MWSLKPFFAFFIRPTSLFVATAIVVFVAVRAQTTASNLPFWKAKPEIYKKVTDERAILVSVKSVEDKSIPTKPNRLELIGGGVIETPQGFAYDQAKDFKNLERMSDHIKNAEWNPKTQILFLHTEAFKYHARMHLHVTFEPPKDKTAGIKFKIVRGVFTGMEGEIRFQPLSLTRTEIGLGAEYRYAEFPIPKLFLEFGLEVVMQKVAEKMRAFIEAEYKRTLKNS